MIRVLFVCHGNICRSPMAEFILKDMVKKKGLSQQFYIASCATSREEIWGDTGNPVYPPAKEILAAHGIDCSGKRAVQLKREDYDQYDYLIAMDSMNIVNMKRIIGHGGDKIHKLMEFAGSDRDVSDPWYTERFDIAYKDIQAGCKGLLEYLLNTGNREE